jgi:hypothetical protein
VSALMDVTPARAYAAPAVSTSRSLLRVPPADTSLPTSFAWLIEPTTTERATAPEADVTDRRPTPDVAPVLRHFQGVLNRLEPQADEGDLSGLAEEIEEWAAYRTRATQPLIDED